MNVNRKEMNADIKITRSRHTPLPTVKAVILGQDPYHNINQAHGLCFSVRPPTPAPPSLKNVYIALKKDYPDFKAPPKNGGLLTPWADRGVLLLNTCLTVRAHEPQSHANRGWEKFTQKVIDIVARVRTRGVVFLAWGTPAGKRVSKVDRKRHLVLQSVHPSPLSAQRGFVCRDMIVFSLGCPSSSMQEHMLINITVRLRSFQKGQRLAPRALRTRGRD